MEHPKGTKRRAKAVAAGALAVCLLAFAGCGSEDAASSAETSNAGTAVETQTVVAGTIASQSRLSGKVIAARNVSVYPPIAAKVLSVRVAVGDTVTDGDVLFTLDKTDIQKNYQPLLDSYNRTKQLTDEQIRQAEKNVADTEALLAIGAASQAELDQAKLTLLSTRTSAETQLSQIDENMKSVRDTLEDTAVKATMTGVITAVSVVAGDTATQQMPSVVISESQKPQVLVSVSESIQPYLKAGDTVLCSIDSIGRTDIPATIATVAPSTNEQTQLYEVRLDLPVNTDVKIGMFADVTFSTDTRAGVMVVPTEAVLTTGEEEYCFIVTGGSTAKRVVVTTGLSSEGRIEVTSGLAAGDALVTVGQSYLSDGAAVRVVSADGEAGE